MGRFFGDFYCQFYRLNFSHTIFCILARFSSAVLLYYSFSSTCGYDAFICLACISLAYVCVYFYEPGSSRLINNLRLFAKSSTVPFCHRSHSSCFSRGHLAGKNNTSVGLASFGLGFTGSICFTHTSGRGHVCVGVSWAPTGAFI